MMQQEKILTIVVPSYNTQQYADTCIPTMLGHQMRGQLEILLVNDGSCDQTLSKLLRYERDYPDTVRVIDKPNGGHGSVVNLGIREARGRYFKVVDGDDWVIGRNLERLMHDLKTVRSDLVVNPYLRHQENTGRNKKAGFHVPKNQELDFTAIADRFSGIGIHAATYRTQLLRENRIRVRENCYYEDTQYIIYPACFVKTVYVLDFPVCVYRVGTQEQSIHPQKAFDNRRMHQKVVMDCCRYAVCHPDLPLPVRRYIGRIICRRIRSQYLIFMKNQKTPDKIPLKESAKIYRELLVWDRLLQVRFPDFYARTGRFPVTWLRSGRLSCFLAVRGLYRLYAAVRR